VSWDGDQAIEQLFWIHDPTTFHTVEDSAMKMESLRDLFIDELKDLYSAENQLIKALPKMAKAATSRVLREAFLSHLEETRGHVQRLEQIFEHLGGSPKGKKCKAMEGLIEEGKEVMEEDAEPEVMDAALIAAAQRVEHYEMAGYGCVRTYAELLGEKDALKLLQKTLNEEGACDDKLTKLSEAINVEAEGSESDEPESTMPKGRATKKRRAVASR
jgi:ferritin-like metal-binding protein YciE